MSLQYQWLLNGTLYDNFNELKFNKVNEPLINNDGKLGKCYYLNNNSYLYIQDKKIKDIVNTNNFSICFWIKINEITDNTPFFNYGNKLFISLIKDGKKLKVNNKDIQCNIKENNWIHVTYLHNKNNEEIYINGKLLTKIKSTNLTLQDNDIFYIGYTNNHFSNSSFNDLRLFNYNLTKKEIKLISQCKINHYDFNICNNNHISDSGILQNHFDINENLHTINEFAIGSGCLEFNNRYLSIPIEPLKTDTYTISFWFKKLSESPYKGMFQLGNDSAMQLISYENGLVRFYPLGLNKNSSLYFDFTYYMNRWYHITMTIEKNKFSLYVNGNKIDSVLSLTLLSDLSINEIFLGINNDLEDSIFDGYVDDLRIYSTVLSHDDIYDLYVNKFSIDKNNQIYVNEINELNPKNTSSYDGKLLYLKATAAKSTFGTNYLMNEFDGKNYTRGPGLNVIIISDNLEKVESKNFDIYNNKNNLNLFKEMIDRVNDNSFIGITLHCNALVNYSNETISLFKSLFKKSNLDKYYNQKNKYHAYIFIGKKNGEVYYEEYTSVLSDTEEKIIDTKIYLPNTLRISNNYSLFTTEINENDNSNNISFSKNGIISAYKFNEI